MSEMTHVYVNLIFNMRCTRLRKHVSNPKRINTSKPCYAMLFVYFECYTHGKQALNSMVSMVFKLFTRYEQLSQNTKKSIRPFYIVL